MLDASSAATLVYPAACGAAASLASAPPLRMAAALALAENAACARHRRIFAVPRAGGEKLRFGEDRLFYRQHALRTNGVANAAVRRCGAIVAQLSNIEKRGAPAGIAAISRVGGSFAKSAGGSVVDRRWAA